MADAGFFAKFDGVVPGTTVNSLPSIGSTHSTWLACGNGARDMELRSSPSGGWEHWRVLDANDACMSAALKADDVMRLTYLWDAGADALSVREEINTGFFTETFVWSELPSGQVR